MRGQLASLLLVAVAFGVAAMGGGARQAAPQKPDEEARAVISAEAVRLGAALQATAPADFLKWARDYLKRNFFKEGVTISGAMVLEAVNKRYPKAPEAARKAAAFLVWYEGYAQASESQIFAAARVKDLDRLIVDAEQRLRTEENAPSKRGQVSARERGPIATEEDRARARLDDLLNQREYLRGHLESFQPRADFCMQRMAYLYPQVKDVDPALLRLLQ